MPSNDTHLFASLYLAEEVLIVVIMQNRSGGYSADPDVGDERIETSRIHIRRGRDQ